MASSVLESSAEKIYGFKLIRLIVDGGTQVLRNVFLKIHPGNLHHVLTTHYLTLYSLFIPKRILTQPQWDKLYPHPPRFANIQEFDITLLAVLLRNICGLPDPSGGWNDMPSSTTKTLQDDIVRIRLFRNKFFGHVPGTDVDRLDFEAHWVEVGSTLCRLGLSQVAIDRLKAEECGEEEVSRVWEKWNESERKTVLKLERIELKLDRLEKIVKEFQERSYESLKQVQSPSDNILSESLHWCNFDNEIQLLLESYTKGTREWVFEQVLTWLDNKSSPNRAFIIAGQAGMGKSVIAAVICKLFHENFAACHFFQFNNSRYNNSKFLLQSLAWQLSNVFPAYKEKVTANLSGCKGQILNDMNIEGLFSLLFKEPFTKCISDECTPFLIVIDALDESRQEDRYELVDLITKHFHKLPSYIRFLITTRTEKDMIHKFQSLNPIFLVPNEERNLNDLRVFFENKLKIKTKVFVENLVATSEGLMLYASFIAKIFEDNFATLNTESLPKGIEEIYESYFKRLENELKIFGIGEDKFLKLLSVIAVAKQPLPSPCIEKLLCPEEDSFSAQRMIEKLISCVSSLLVVKDECISIFHKSIRDWLVKPGHSFTIIEKYGHKTLADICVDKMQRLQENEVRFTYDMKTDYALQFGVPHILEAQIEDKHALAKLIDNVIDLVIVHESICVNVHSTIENFAFLEVHNIYPSLSKKTQSTIKTLISITRKAAYILKDVPQSFLQHVVNEGDEELSSKASTLLMTRYKELAYFECKKKCESIEEAMIGFIQTKKKIWDIDLSMSEEFVVCGYEKGGIELFSLSNFGSIWKIEDFVVERRCAFRGRGVPETLWGKIESRLRCIVFHPSRNVIFPGQVDRVISLEGNFEAGPFEEHHDDHECTKFTNCCFSNDKSKMATNYGDHLTLWNLRDNCKIISLPCRSELYSILFSADDRYLATTNVSELCVYDVSNSCSIISQSSCTSYTIIISAFGLDSWYCKSEKKGDKIVRYDQSYTAVPRKKPFTLLPLNQRAEGEFQKFIEKMDMKLFDKLKGKNLFMLSNGNALLLGYDRKELQLLSRFIELVWSFELSLTGQRSFSGCSFSFDGSYFYASCTKYKLKKHKQAAKKRNKLAPLVPVSSGIFFQTPPKSGDRYNHFQPDGLSCKFICTCSISNDLHKNKHDESGTQICSPELWDFEMTKPLSTFPELSGTLECISVTEDLVACVMNIEVCFFSVCERKVLKRIPLPRIESKVVACSSKYDVLLQCINGPVYLARDEMIDLSLLVLKSLEPIVNSVDTACFSPDAQLLVFCSDERKKLYILDVDARKILWELLLKSKGYKMDFIDDEHVLCRGYKNCLCLINVKTCKMMTCINWCAGNDEWSFCSCRKTGDIMAYGLRREELKYIKLWLPYQRENATEIADHAVRGSY